MHRYRIVCVTTLLIGMLSMSPVTLATIVTFDLRDNTVSSDLDGSQFGQLMNSGLGAIFTSLESEGTNSVFNHTSSSFGINTLSTTLDSPSLIDGGAAWSEAVQLVFSELVYLREITLSSFTPLEWASLRVPGQPEWLLNGQSSARDRYSFADILIPAGASLVLSHVAGNGFSLDSFRVETSRVPEPSGFQLMLLALGFLFLRRLFNFPACSSADG